MTEKRQTKAMQERHERILNELLKIPGNEYCADCRSKNPRWASYSLGVFLCVRCAGIHRKMGTHISRIKSLSMDQWTVEQIDSIKNGGGNIKVNNIVNPNPSKYPLPLADDEGHAMENYIRNKWEKRAFMERPSLASSSSLAVVPNGVQEQSRPRNVPMRSSSVPAIMGENGGAALIKLHEMGFKDDYKNQVVLRQTQGNLNAAVEVLSRYTNNQQPQPLQPQQPQQQRDTQHSLTIDQKLVQLRNMGYTDMTTNRDALRRTGGNVDVAVTVLKSSQSATTNSTPSSSSLSGSLFSAAINGPQQQQQGSGNAQLLDLSVPSPPIMSNINNNNNNNISLQFQSQQPFSVQQPQQQQYAQQSQLQQQQQQHTAQPQQPFTVQQPQQYTVQQQQPQLQQQLQPYGLLSNQQASSPFAISSASDPFGQNTLPAPIQSISLQTTHTTGMYPSANVNHNSGVGFNNTQQMNGMSFQQQQQSFIPQATSNPFASIGQQQSQPLSVSVPPLASSASFTNYFSQQPQPQPQQLFQPQQQAQPPPHPFSTFQQQQQMSKSSFF